MVKPFQLVRINFEVNKLEYAEKEKEEQSRRIIGRMELLIHGRKKGLV